MFQIQDKVKYNGRIYKICGILQVGDNLLYNLSADNETWANIPEKELSPCDATGKTGKHNLDGFFEEPMENPMKLTLELDPFDIPRLREELDKWMSTTPKVTKKRDFDEIFDSFFEKTAEAKVKKAEPFEGEIPRFQEELDKLLPTTPKEEKKENAHYARLSPQPIEYMQQAMTPEQFQGFCLGNVLKYALRFGHKDKKDKEAKKIFDYAMWLVDSTEGKKVHL